MQVATENILIRMNCKQMLLSSTMSIANMMIIWISEVKWYIKEDIVATVQRNTVIRSEENKLLT